MVNYRRIIISHPMWRIWIITKLEPYIPHVRAKGHIDTFVVLFWVDPSKRWTCDVDAVRSLKSICSTYRFLLLKASSKSSFLSVLVNKKGETYIFLNFIKRFPDTKMNNLVDPSRIYRFFSFIRPAWYKTFFSQTGLTVNVHERTL